MNSRVWSKKDDAILARLAGKLSPDEIVDFLPLRTVNAIKMRMSIKGLSSKVEKSEGIKRKRVTMVEVERVVGIYLNCNRSTLKTCVSAKIEQNRLKHILSIARSHDIISQENIS